MVNRDRAVFNIKQTISFFKRKNVMALELEIILAAHVDKLLFFFFFACWLLIWN
jgi:hypothetical protein